MGYKLVGIQHQQVIWLKAINIILLEALEETTPIIRLLVFQKDYG